MKKIFALLITVSFLFALCSCDTISNVENKNEEIQYQSNSAKMDAIKSKLDTGFNGYDVSITDSSVILTDETKGDSKVCKYTVVIDKTYSEDFYTIHKVLYHMKSGVSIDDEHYEHFIIEGAVECNNETYYLDNYAKFILRKKSDLSWEYNTIIDKNGEGLTSEEKKYVCNDIQYWYDYYDKQEGKYAGDKHSDEIFSKISNKYHIPVDDLKVIWMNYYSY